MPREISDAVKKKIATLSWRRAIGNQEYYTFPVGDLVLNISQRKQGELTGLGTGGNVWNAVIVFSKWLEKLTKTMNDGASKFQARDLNWHGKRIIELGSGTGLGSIVCSLLMKEVKSIVMTDQIRVLPIMSENVERHRPMIPELEKVSLMNFDWGSNPYKIFKGDDSPPFDWVIACDCITPIFPLDLLYQSLIDLTDEHSTIVLAYEHRQFTEKFWDIVASSFEVTKIPPEEMDINYCDDDIDILILKKKKFGPLPSN